jgi:hypothetical protein
MGESQIAEPKKKSPILSHYTKGTAQYPPFG